MDAEHVPFSRTASKPFPLVLHKLPLTLRLTILGITGFLLLLLSLLFFYYLPFIH